MSAGPTRKHYSGAVLGGMPNLARTPTKSSVDNDLTTLTIQDVIAIVVFLWLKIEKL